MDPVASQPHRKLKYIQRTDIPVHDFGKAQKKPEEVISPCRFLYQFLKSAHRVMETWIVVAARNLCVSAWDTTMRNDR